MFIITLFDWLSPVIECFCTLGHLRSPSLTRLQRNMNIPTSSWSKIESGKQGCVCAGVSDLRNPNLMGTSSYLHNKASVDGN